MNSVDKPKKPVKRSIRLGLAPHEAGPGLVTITCGKTVADYYLRPLASDFGQGFELEKFSHQGSETYHVNLNGRESHCECKGFLRHGHCKHIDGLQALLAAGQLPGGAVPELQRGHCAACNAPAVLGHGGLCELCTLEREAWSDERAAERDAARGLEPANLTPEQKAQLEATRA
jgi:hypothetical protein